MRVAVVVGLLAACHGSHPATGDAAGPGGGDASGDGTTMLDAAPDAVDAPARGTMTVTVYGDGQDRNPGVPVPGAEVYFVEPDSTATKITTGADGVAIAQEPNNTTVWVVHHDGSTAYDIETYEGVLIGDSIIGGNPNPLGQDTVGGTAYIAFPSFSDATLYDLTLSCTSGLTQSSASPIAQNWLACGHETAANAIVWATDSMGNLGYTSVTNVALAAHASAATALSLPAFQPGATIGVTFTNLPASMGQSTADIHGRYTNGTDPTILQDVELREGTLTDTMSGSAPIAPFGDTTRVYGLVYIDHNVYAYNYDATTTGLASSVTIDASTMVHPANLWTYDAGTNAVTWTQQTFGVDPTVVESQINWNGSYLVEWYLMAPYSGGPSLALPAFPSDLATVMSSPSGAGFKQLDLTSYAGKVYHDVLVRQTGGAASWDIGVGP